MFSLDLRAGTPIKGSIIRIFDPDIDPLVGAYHPCYGDDPCRALEVPSIYRLCKAQSIDGRLLSWILDIDPRIIRSKIYDLRFYNPRAIS